MLYLEILKFCFTKAMMTRRKNYGRTKIGSVSLLVAQMAQNLRKKVLISQRLWIIDTFNRIFRKNIDELVFDIKSIAQPTPGI